MGNVKKIENIFIFCILSFMFFMPVSKSAANVALIMAAITGVLLGKKYQVDYKNILHQPLMKPIFLFFFVILITVPFSLDVFNSFREYLRLVSYVLPFVIFVLLKTIKGKFITNINNIFHSYLMGCVVASFYAIYQYLQTKQLYVTAFYGHHAIFASFLETALPIIAVLFIGELRISRKIGYLVAGSVCFIAIILTQARGPWVGALAALTVVAGIMRERIMVNKKIVVIGLLIVMGIALCTMPLYVNRVKTINDMSWASNYHRLLIWESTINMIKDYPITGVGLGQFVKVYNAQYISPLSLERFHPHAHNSYLMLCVESGIAALVIFIYLLYKIGALLIVLLKNKQVNHYVIAYIGIFVAILINSLVDNFFWAPYVSKILWLMLGLIVYNDDFIVL